VPMHAVPYLGHFRSVATIDANTTHGIPPQSTFKTTNNFPSVENKQKSFNLWNN
jgi:hypothetical protein